MVAKFSKDIFTAVNFDKTKVKVSIFRQLYETFCIIKHPLPWGETIEVSSKLI